MKYRAEIDGLRTVAVFPVILFHAGFAGFGGGFVGVDVFFVISGYLITTIIVSELAQERFSILRFYERRARRILPALFLVMLTCIPLAWLWMMPRDMVDFAESLAAAASFTSNIFFWSEAGYFTRPGELKPMLHTWSLAVEEQYYILFPPFMILIWGLGLRKVALSIGVLFGLSLALSHFGAYAKPDATFFWLPTRAWELLIGSLCALYVHRRGLPDVSTSAGALRAQIASLIGLALVAFAIVAFDKSTPFPSLYALVPTVGTALVLLYARSGTLVHMVLTRKLFVGIGLISYSAYLWHQPLFAFARYRSVEEPGLLLMLGLILATFGLAALSWRFVEAPFRQAGRFDRRFIFTASIIGILGFVGFGLAGSLSQGFPNRAVVAKLDYLDYQPDNLALQEESWSLLRQRSGVDDYDVQGNSFDRQSWFDPDSDKSRLLVVGNSHAKDIYNVLSLSETVSARFETARFGIQIRRIQPDFFEYPNYRAADVIVIGSRYLESDLTGFDWFFERLRADGKQPVIIRNIFEFNGTGWKTLADTRITAALLFGDAVDPDALMADVNHAYYTEFTTRSRRAAPARSDARIDRLVQQFPEIIVLDRMDYVCDRTAEECFGADARLNKFFYDYGHHTLAGATFFARRVDETGWFDPVLEAMR